MISFSYRPNCFLFHSSTEGHEPAMAPPLAALAFALAGAAAPYNKRNHRCKIQYTV